MNKLIKEYLESIEQTDYEVKRALQIGLRTELFNGISKATKLEDEVINEYLDSFEFLQLVTVDDDVNNVLNQRCEEVTEDEMDQAVSQLREMVTVMKDGNGCGLAANQVGILKRMFVFEDRPTSKSRTPKINFVINPKIIRVSKRKISKNEGCLSYPDRTMLVPRYKEIFVSYFNGKVSVRRKLTDYEARVFQHEFSHLEGNCPLGEYNEV